jgi:Dr1-associated corepressor
MVHRRKKYETKLPVARIKKVIQKDEQIGKLSALTPFAISKALELFMADLMHDLIQWKRQSQECQPMKQEYQSTNALKQASHESVATDAIEKGEIPETKRGRGRPHLNASMIRIKPQDLLSLIESGHPAAQGTAFTTNDHSNESASTRQFPLPESLHKGYYWFLRDLILGKQQNGKESAEVSAASSGVTGGDIYAIGNQKGKQKLSASQGKRKTNDFLQEDEDEAIEKKKATRRNPQSTRRTKCATDATGPSMNELGSDSNLETPLKLLIDSNTTELFDSHLDERPHAIVNVQLTTSVLSAALTDEDEEEDYDDL